MSRWISPFGLEILLLTGFLTSLGLILSLVFFSGPAEDDFTIWMMVRSHPGILETVRVYFVGQTGRWVGTLLSGAIALKMDYFLWYPSLLLLVALASLAGWIAFVRAIGMGRITWLGAVAGGTVLYSLLLAGSPALSESVLWLNGALYYPLGIALGQVLFLGCLRLSRSPPASPLVRYASMTLLLGGSVAMGGFNEVLAVWWVLILGGSAMAAARQKVLHRGFWNLMLIGAVAGLLLAVLAPGNSVRLDAYETPPSETELWSRIIQLFVSQTAQWVGQWLLDPRALLLFALYLLWPTSRLPPADWTRGRSGNFAVCVLGLWIAGMLIGFFIPSFALRRPMPVRTLSAMHSWYLMGALMMLTLTVRHRADSYLSRLPALPMLRSGASVLMLLTLALTGNVPEVMGEFRSGVIAQHDANYRALHDRLHLAQRAGERDVTIPPLPMSSKILYRQAVTEDPGHVGNRHLCYYYGFDSIRVYPDGASHALRPGDTPRAAPTPERAESGNARP